MLTAFGVTVLLCFVLAVANAAIGFWPVAPIMPFAACLAFAGLCVVAYGLGLNRAHKQMAANGLIACASLLSGLLWPVLPAMAIIIGAGAAAGLFLLHGQVGQQPASEPRQDAEPEVRAEPALATISRDSTLGADLALGKLTVLSGERLADRLHINDRVPLLRGLLDGQATLVSRVNTAGIGEPERFEPMNLALFSNAGTIHIVGSVCDDEGIIEPQVEAPQPPQQDKTVLAFISHELRTPLNAIIGFSDMLISPELGGFENDQQRDRANAINGASRDLLELVETLLDASKIDAGLYRIHPEPFAMKELIESCVALVAEKAAAKSIHLTARVPQTLPLCFADRRAVRQIVINLVSNAIKFTPDRGCIGIEIDPQGEKGGFILKVTDTGIGIALDQQERVFEPFARVDNAFTRCTEGTGLGLALVQGLVNLHGGSLQLQSDLDVGTSIDATFPGDVSAEIGSQVAGRNAPLANKVEPAAVAPLDGRAERRAV